MFTKKRQATLGILAALGGLGLATTAAADTPQSTVILNTATTLIKEAPNGPANKPVAQKTGAGVMDNMVAYEKSTGLLAATMTWSTAKPNNNNSYMQGALALAKIDPVQGLTNSQFIDLPVLEGDRPHMRPNIAIGSNFLVDVFASEDHSDNNNGNPQVVAWVFDKTGKMLTITNSTRSDPQKPTNLIDLTGNNDGQQYGPHSVLALGTQPDGSEAFILGVQRNNQQAQVLGFTVKADANGATVNGLYRKTIIQNAQHNRVSIAIPPDFIAHNNRIVATAVEANTQPANIGVRAVLVDTTNGSKIASTLIAASDPNQGVYAVQPTAQWVSDSLVTVEYQMSGTKNRNGNNGNGHANYGSNLSNLALLKVPTAAGGQFTVADSLSRVAPYQRHAEAFGMQYGPDNATLPSVGIIGGSSTGYGKGLVQVIPVDTAQAKLGAIDPMKLYEVSTYSDVAMLPARAKRNPNNQARGFIRGVFGIDNPGFGNANGFMPEVKTFTLSSVAGYKDATTSNRESLFFSLIPSVWTHTVQTVPGSVTPNVPPGPSPVATPPAQGGPTPTNPGVAPTQPSSGSGDMPSVPSTPSGTGPHASGFGQTDGQAAGCACTTAPGSSSTSGLAGLSILAMGLALLGFRRTKKES